MLFFTVFFQKFACGAENLTKTGTKPRLGIARKIISGRPKKMVDKIFEIFLKIPPPPRENPRSARGNYDTILLQREPHGDAIKSLVKHLF